MRLDFNVLWLDDQFEAIRSYHESLEHKMRKEGFELKVKSAKTVEEALNYVGDSVFADLIDLVLVDYELGGEIHGDQVLSHIRSKVNYKDIIFYSAQSTRDLRTLAFEQKVEGVYCTTRSSLVETAFGVFEALTKKVLDLDHTRGIVMGATSDIDHVVHESLVALHESLPEGDRAVLLAKMLEKISKKVEQLSSKATGAKTFELALVEYDLITSYDRLRLVMDLLKDETNEEAKEIRKQMGRYLADIVPKRNLLGHVRMVLNEEGKRLLRSHDGSKELTEMQLKDLRRDLLDHRENFERLSVFLKPRN